MIEQNYLTWQSQDRNRISHLAITDSILRSGPNDLVIYYLFPSRSRMHDVELVVKSAYRKHIDFERIKRRFNVQQMIKTAYFRQIRMP